jgi:hypothetical protein
MGERAAAFKYTVKAGDQAISRGAFAKGYEFCDQALKMALTQTELEVFLVVLSRGYEDLRLGDTLSISSTQNLKFTLDNFTNRMIKDFNHIRVSDRIGEYMYVFIYSFVYNVYAFMYLGIYMYIFIYIYIC